MHSAGIIDDETLVAARGDDTWIPFRKIENHSESSRDFKAGSGTQVTNWRTTFHRIRRILLSANPILYEVPQPGANAATRTRRFFAKLLDLGFLIFCLGPSLAFVYAHINDEYEDGIPIEFYVCVVVGAAIYLAFQFTMLTIQGHTVGKRLMRLKVVNAGDGDTPGFVRGVLLRSIVPVAVLAIPIIGMGFGVGEFWSIFRRDRRLLHDLISGTKVIRTNR